MIKKIIIGVTLVCVILSLFGCYKDKDLITPDKLVLNPDIEVLIAYAKDGKTYNFEERGGVTVTGKILRGFIENGKLIEISLSELVAVCVEGESSGNFAGSMLGLVGIIVLLGALTM